MKSSPNNTLLTLFVLIVFVLMGNTHTQAQNSLGGSIAPITVPGNYVPLAPLPNLTTMTPNTSVSFQTYAQDMYDLLVAAGAVAAVFMITWGGFEYMTTTDAVGGKKEGLAKIENAIYGLLLILSSYLILRTIDPRFVNVPQSLVPPLNIEATNQISDWTSSLQKQLANWKSGDASTSAAISSALIQNNQLANEATTLAQQIKSASGQDPNVACAGISYNSDPMVTDLCSSWLDNQNAQVNLKTNTLLNVYNKELSSTLGQGLTDLTFTSTQLAARATEVSLENNYNTLRAQLIQQGGSPDQVASLDNTFNYVDSRLVLINAATAGVTVGASEIRSVINEGLPKITDPALEQQAIQVALLATDNVNKNAVSQGDVQTQTLLASYKKVLQSMVTSK